MTNICHVLLVLLSLYGGRNMHCFDWVFYFFIIFFNLNITMCVLEMVGSAWGRVCFGSAPHFAARETLFHSWANPKETLPCTTPRSLLCDEPVAAAANGRAQREQVRGAGPWCWEPPGHIWQVRVVLWCCGTAPFGFHFIQKKTKRLKQSSGSKEHCGKPHFLSELLPHYGCDPQMQLIREMKPVEKEKPLSDAQTQC